MGTNFGSIRGSVRSATNGLVCSGDAADLLCREWLLNAGCGDSDNWWSYNILEYSDGLDRGAGELAQEAGHTSSVIMYMFAELQSYPLASPVGKTTTREHCSFHSAISVQSMLSWKLDFGGLIM